MRDQVISIAKSYGLDPDFVCAVVKTESGWRPSVVRFEPKWRYFVSPAAFAKTNGITEDTEQQLQMFSWGLTQIMGGKARELGYTGMLTELIKPELCVELSCQFMRRLFDRYKSYEHVAAAYNAGTPIMDFQTHKFRNQEYVDTIMSNLGG